MPKVEARRADYHVYRKRILAAARDAKAVLAEHVRRLLMGGFIEPDA